MSLYLDYNATAPIRPEAAEAVSRALEIGGNPSSVHAAGRAARARIETARERVAALIGAPSGAVAFTSGGAEANGLAVASAVAAGSRHLIVGASEHDSLLQSARASGAEVELWPVDSKGVADMAWLDARLDAWPAGDGRPFVALMLANNETGVVQPVAEAALAVRKGGGWLHTDAVAAAGKLAIDFRALGVDSLTLSAHKLGGPQGVGALAVGSRVELRRQIHGGGQERGRRAGTENLSGIAGFGAAARVALGGLEAMQAQAQWRDAAADRLRREGGAVVMGEGATRLPNTLNLACKGFAAELQVMQLDLAGVMVSAGAACSSGKVAPSHVLAAMGQGELAACAVRASGGWATQAQDWERFADAWLTARAAHTARRSQSAA